MATKYWNWHPHRFFGYDLRRKVPFFIDMACDDCAAEDHTSALAATYFSLAGSSPLKS